MEQKCKKILDPWSSLIDEISFEKDYFISFRIQHNAILPPISPEIS
jgi:hypothetical protein